MTPDCKAGVLLMIPTPLAVSDANTCRLFSGVQLVPVGTSLLKMGRISPALSCVASGTHLWYNHLDAGQLVNQISRIYDIAFAERARIYADEAFSKVVNDGASHEKMRARNSKTTEGLDRAKGAVERLWAQRTNFWYSIGRSLLSPPHNLSKELGFGVYWIALVYKCCRSR